MCLPKGLSDVVWCFVMGPVAAVAPVPRHTTPICCAPSPTPTATNHQLAARAQEDSHDPSAVTVSLVSQCPPAGGDGVEEGDDGCFFAPTGLDIGVARLEAQVFTFLTASDIIFLHISKPGL